MALDQITEALVKDYLEEAAMISLGAPKDFERFVTHVVVSPHIEGPIDYENVLSGDGGDTGLDSISIVVNGELVTDPDVIDTLADDGATLDVQYIFTQAKTASNFSTAEVGQISYGVVDFFSSEPSLERNEVVAAAVELSAKVLANARLFRNGNPTCAVYYATVGRWLEDPDLVARCAAAEADLDALTLFSKVSFVPLDARMVQRRFHGLRSGTEREFVFQNRIPLPDIDLVAEAHLGYIPAEGLLTVLADDDGSLSGTVFYENVRDFQGSETPVNSGIRETILSDRRGLFPLMNNGITIIAKGMRQTGTKFVIQDFQVVNGCQTCNVLWENRDSLDESVLVPLRLISTEDEDSILDIIRATNRQTEVKDEQFFATSDYLKTLEQYFETSPPERRLFLERRSKQYANSNVERTRVVPFNSLVRSFASVFLNEPHRATRNYKQVLARIPDDILNPSHKPSIYLAAASSLYRLEFLFRNGVLDRHLSPAKYHLLLISRLIISAKPPQLNGREADRWGEELLRVYWDQQASEDVFKEAAKVVERLSDGDLTRDRIRTQGFTELVLDEYTT